MKINRPYLLSLHPTMQCDYNCFNCYLKKDEDDSIEKSPEFFLKLIEVAKKVGMTEVAMAVNFVEKKKDFQLLDDPSDVWDQVDKNVYYFNWVKNKCKEVGLTFTATVNYDFITNYKGHIDFKDIELMSISINDFVTSTEEKKNEAIRTMKELKEHIPNINCNILLSPNMVKQLNAGLDQEILEVADTIYLLFSEPLYIPLEKAYEQIRNLKSTVLTMIDDRVLLDTCIKREMGMTGGICAKHEQIFVNPYGEIKKCSFDTRDLFKLKKPEDLEHVYANLYPPAPLETCDLINGKNLAERKLKLKTEREENVKKG